MSLLTQKDNSVNDSVDNVFVNGQFDDVDPVNGSFADVIYAQAVENVKFFLSTMYHPTNGPITSFEIHDPSPSDGLIPGVVEGNSVVHFSMVLAETSVNVPFFQPTILGGYRFVVINSSLSWLENDVEHIYPDPSIEGQLNLCNLLNETYLQNQATYVATGEKMHVTPIFSLSQFDDLTNGKSDGYYKKMTQEVMAIVKLN
jgi:hypothetical protein